MLVPGTQEHWASLRHATICKPSSKLLRPLSPICPIAVALIPQFWAPELRVSPLRVQSPTCLTFSPRLDPSHWDSLSPWICSSHLHIRAVNSREADKIGSGVDTVGVAKAVEASLLSPWKPQQSVLEGVPKGWGRMFRAGSELPSSYKSLDSDLALLGSPSA